MNEIPRSRKLKTALENSKWGYLEVSGGTLRTFDLFHAFRDAAKLYAPMGTISKFKVGFYLVPKSAKYDDKHDFWETETAWDIVNALVDLLDAISPEGYRFGASEGDGACFGWWETTDEEI